MEGLQTHTARQQAHLPVHLHRPLRHKRYLPESENEFTAVTEKTHHFAHRKKGTKKLNGLKLN